MRGRSRFWLPVVLATALASASAQATDFFIALGPAVVPDYEGSDDYEATISGIFSAVDLYDPNTFVNIIGPRLDSQLLPHPNWRLGVSAEYIPARNDVEDDAVDALPKTDDAIFLGADFGYDFDARPAYTLALEADARGDLTGEQGGLFGIRGVYARPFGTENKFFFQGRIEANYATTDYMSNYFSVSPADSIASGLPAFDAEAGFKDVRTRLILRYRFTERWSITGVGIYARLLNDAADSPITNDENQFSAAVLAGFHF